MKAILLSAGYGSRLRPLTDTIPKCLIPIRGVPILEIWLNKLFDAGFSEVLVNTHYLSKKVEEFIQNYKFRDKVKLSYEEDLLGTAGTLINNIDYFGGSDGLILHADNYTNIDIKSLIKCHNARPENTLVTMVIFKTSSPELCGIVELNKFGVVINFHEKQKKIYGNLANGAIYMLSSKYLKDLHEKKLEVKEFTTELIPKILGKINTYYHQGYFIDIGTPENYILSQSIDL